MPAYLIARMEVLDREAFAPYVEKTPDIVARFGGEYLVNGGKWAEIEGDSPGRHVLIRFTDMAAARAFYHSESFQRVLPLAKTYTKRDLILVEGV